MKRGNISRWPVHFLRYVHNWNEYSKVNNKDEDGYNKFSCFKCQDCDTVALQDSGSLSFYIVDSELEFNELTCDELQIKDIIEN
jgi:hypothetical protein